MMTLLAIIIIFAAGMVAGYKLGYDHVMQDVQRIVKVTLSHRRE